MNYYVDIDLRPDPEFPPNQLMSALYAKLHRALVARDSADIGVSFPGFDAKAPHLGTCLRLHGELSAVSELMASAWLTSMRDHIETTDPAAVPGNSQFRIVRRVQAHSNPERMRRRLMRRQQIDEAQARLRIPDSTAEFLELPFVQLCSTSTGQPFRLFIEHGPLRSEQASGTFSAYGLSPSATVPWF